MPLFHLILLAVIQGLTEFLPVSSSGHLILLPQLTGAEDQGQAIDVAVHVGTLGAVLLYFRSDFARVGRGIPQLLGGRAKSDDARLAQYLLISTIPIVIFGAILKVTGLDQAVRSIAVIGWTMLIFGLILFWADKRSPVHRRSHSWNLRDAWTMGLAQALALIPGTSRSGITITASRALGFAREDAARLAMLMSVPAILMSGGYLIVEALWQGNTALWRDAAIAAALAFVAAMLALSLMMRLLRSVSFTPYVIYRVILGLILLAIAYT